MVNRREFARSSAFIVPAMTTALSSNKQIGPVSPSESHQTWVLSIIDQMSTVSVGMTRADLVKVFQQQGGISSAGAGTFLSRACMYFMVDVEFELKSPREISPQDVIGQMSRPYLARTGRLD